MFKFIFNFDSLTESDRNAFIAPISSILLFVVGASLPPSSTTFSQSAIIAPHPPGPGFPLEDPSEKIVITSFIQIIIS